MIKRYSIKYISNGQELRFNFETENTRVPTHLVKALSQLPNVQKVVLCTHTEHIVVEDTWEKHN